jgi:hypothetical protein
MQFFTNDYVTVFAKIALRAVLRKNCIVGSPAQKLHCGQSCAKIALRAVLRNNLHCGHSCF